MIAIEVGDWIQKTQTNQKCKKKDSKPSNNSIIESMLLLTVYVVLFWIFRQVRTLLDHENGNINSHVPNVFLH